MTHDGRVVVIAGATGELGAYIARQMASQEYRVVLLGTSAKRLERLEDELHLPAERALSFVGDLTRLEDVQQLRDVVIDKYGGADILLNLVGGWIGGKAVAEVAPGDISNMLAQHLWTTVHLAQAFIPGMKERGWGRVIVVSSSSVEAPPGYNLPYVVGKSAQEAVVLTLAEELKFTGVTANILRVRTIDTQHERDHTPSPDNAAWTTPEEICSAILYLCSEEAKAVNGARIPLYGSH